MKIKKEIKKIESEFRIEFPFRYCNVNIYEIEEKCEEVLIDQMYFYKYVSISNREKEDIEAYLSYLNKLQKYFNFN